MKTPMPIARTLLTASAFAVVLVLGACGPSSEPPQAAETSAARTSAPTAQSESSTSMSPPTPAPTPGANNAETAKGSDDAKKPMTKDEESTSMPRPSQANDHSTLAKDSKQ